MFQIRRVSAVWVLFAATLGGGLVAALLTYAVKQPTPPVAMAAAPSVSERVEPLFSFAPVVKKAMPAVVNVSSSKVIKAQKQMRDNPMFQDPFFRQFFGDGSGGGAVPKDRKEHSLGSGVIIQSDGLILTNNHVINGATDVRVALSDRREFPAKVVGADPQTDVAVLRIDAKGLPTMPIGSSAKAQVGDVVLAIGNPFGVGQTVTMGIIGALGRSRLGIEDYEQFIQTDASINPGNSGGALIDTRGQLIGINTAILSRTGGNNGVGFAIPIDLANRVSNEIVKSGKVVRGYIGAYIQDVTPSLAKAMKATATTGAVISQVEPGGPAEKAGLQPGDIVTKVNGSPVEDSNAFRFRIAEMAPGSTANMTVVRDGSTRDIGVKLGERQKDASRQGSNSGGTTNALDGVSVDNLTPDVLSQLGLKPFTKGVVVTGVDDGSAAAAAGLQQGDVITQVNRKPVVNVTEYEQAIRQNRSDTVLLMVNRGGRMLFLAVGADQ